MINTLGKSLVCVQLVLSTLFLAFAVATYAQMNDFGWQKPREELGQQIASEYDKHAAALQLALQAKVRAEAALQAAEQPVNEPGQPPQKSIAEAMLHRHGN